MQLIGNTAFIAFIVLCLVACDCGQIVKGIVLDKHTKRPIPGANVQKIYRTDQSKYYQPRYLSDSSGGFAVHYMAGGVLGCPDFQLAFSKPGYTAQKKAYNGILLGDTTYLEKVK
jgi:hypothetical protein